MKLYRQGDILLQEIARLPANLVKVPSKEGKLVLAEGEITGHAHTMTDNDCALFAIAASDGIQYGTDGFGQAACLTVRKANALLAHEEHATLIIPKGFYRVIKQREYSPVANGSAPD